MAELRRMRPLLGTFVEIGVVESRDSERTSLAITRAFEVIEQMHNLLSFHNPNSELSRLNRSGELMLHPLSVLALRLARGVTRASNGLFNCTVGGRMISSGVLPNHASGLPLPNGDAEDIDIRGYRVKLRRALQITLDGIAKGLAVDLAARALRSAGVESGWINAGGDLLAFGDAAVPVSRRELDDTLAPLGVLRNGAIASSAVTETPDARFPGRIVGACNESPAVGVWSVHATSAWRADALTKVAALAPSNQRASLIEYLGGQLLTPIQPAPMKLASTRGQAA